MLQQHSFKYLALIAGLVLMGLVGTVSMSFAQGDSWTTKAPMPKARATCASCVLDGKIYVMGGFDNYYLQAFRTVEVFDPKTNTWTTSKDLPLPIIDKGAACALNGKIYVVGGLGSGANAIGTLFEFDPTTQNWTQKAPMPTPRCLLDVCVVNEKIYVIGGHSGKAPIKIALQAVEEYDPMTDSWTAKAPLPEPTVCLAAAVVNGKIYVFGGEIALYSGRPFKAVWEYDPASDSWTRKKDMPTARIFHVACTVNGMIYVIGGNVDYGSPGLQTNEEYDPETDTWCTRANMPTQRAFFSGGVVDNKIYTIGGSTTGFIEGIVSTVEEYIPPTPAPYITYHSYHVDDSEGNNNENPDPGESVKLIVTLRNIRFDALNVPATLRSSDPDVQISQATANFGDISRNQINTNQNNPFIFSVAATCKPHFSKFYLDISGSGGYARVDSFQMIIGTPDFLLVDDDGGANYEDYYLKCLPQAKWDVSSKGCPTVSVAQTYKAMIWFTGNDRENTLTSEEQAFLANYLDNGGRLLLTGQDIGYDLIQKGSTSDAAFYANYLHAKLISDSANTTSIRGVRA